MGLFGSGDKALLKEIKQTLARVTFPGTDVALLSLCDINKAKLNRTILTLNFCFNIPCDDHLAALNDLLVVTLNDACKFSSLELRVDYEIKQINRSVN